MNAKEQVKYLLKKCSPNSLQLAVNFISFDSSFQELRLYLLENKNLSPNLRELFRTLNSFDDQEIAELVSLSRSIANSNCSLNSIIPLNLPESDLKDTCENANLSCPDGKEEAESSNDE